MNGFSPNFRDYYSVSWDTDELNKFWGQRSRSHYRGGGVQHWTLPSSSAFQFLNVTSHHFSEEHGTAFVILSDGAVSGQWQIGPRTNEEAVKVKTGKYPQSANLQQAAIMNFVECYIFHAKITVCRIAALKHDRAITEVFQEGDFDRDL